MNPPRPATPLPASATARRVANEPAYEVLHQLDEQIEIRRYAPYAVAEAFAAGPPDGAGQQAFPLLDGYIGGKNIGAHAFPKTVPVTHSALDGGTLVRFVLPKGVTLATAPKPIHSRVLLREIAGHTLAAIRYSGRWLQAHDHVHVERLVAALRAAGMRWAGEPRFARYNAPWSPWFLRRNEVWLRLP